MSAHAASYSSTCHRRPSTSSDALYTARWYGCPYLRSDQTHAPDQPPDQPSPPHAQSFTKPGSVGRRNDAAGVHCENIPALAASDWPI
eukprot:4098702-Pyramimonas_sp.AAC.1